MTMKRMQPDWSFKILLIGDSGVGKTCLMFRFAGMYILVNVSDITVFYCYACFYAMKCS